jgi:hypothetical protein
MNKENACLICDLVAYITVAFLPLALVIVTITQ